MEGGEAVILPVEQLLPDRAPLATLWVRLAAGLEDAVTSGALPPGARLENEIALSERLGVSRPTVRRAIQELVDKGLLVRRRGIGTQVVHGSVARQIELTSLFDDLASAGKVPGTRVLELAKVPATPLVATQLGVAPEAEVLRIRRLRLADDVPLAVLQNYLPPALADLDEQELADAGLYGGLRSRGVVLRVARQRIGARKATNEEARLLDLTRGAPVLTMDRTAYDADGAAVEYGHHCYRPDLYSFEMTLVDR
ncbi:GntR family transcriptional regulator IolR [Amnibacterium soli]|uniref:GntR family transcriptional regulator IolR n=1 Tax=Amnibacterium soli TaxID=1282736 RepID=A0ABP8ZFW8_9MICO